MLISEEYRQLNVDLHQTRADYGKSSSQWCGLLFALCAQQETTDVLDYGCGKGTLGLGMPFAINHYDPAVMKWNQRPQIADIVVCTDVLEHIEPDCLGNVIADLRGLTRKRAVLGIPHVPAKKKLADGRNAHLIVEPREWWTERVFELFTLEEEQTYPNYTLWICS